MKLYSVALSLPKALYIFIKNTLKHAILIGTYSKFTSREE